MRRSVPAAMALGLLLSAIAAIAVLAHEGSGEEEILVEPSTVTAGETVVLAGSGLEPNDERVIVLVGQHDTIHLTEVETDAEGMFSLELTVPAHLPAGTYELQAIGDETLSVPLAVTAAAGAVDVPNAAEESVAARQRGPVDLAIILAFVAITVALGGWLIWRAERFRGVRTA
ncbi:MAG: hypothetical protein AB1736_03585 [Chloroflexota bacterium]